VPVARNDAGVGVETPVHRFHKGLIDQRIQAALPTEPLRPLCRDGKCSIENRNEKVFDPRQRQNMKRSSTQLNAGELPYGRAQRGFVGRLASSRLALGDFPA
jgi:hypothetical protein